MIGLAALQVFSAACLAQTSGATSAAVSEPPAEVGTVTDNLRDQPTAPGAAADDHGGLRTELTGWIWIVGMDGTVGARGTRADVSADFGDVLEASDSVFAFAGRLEVGLGSWGGFIDGMYSKLGADDQSGPVGLANIDVTCQTVLTDFGLMYRVGEWEPDGEAGRNARDITLDLYAGGRYTNLDLDLEPAALPSRSQSVDWFDPIVGAKLGLPFAEEWRLALNGDIGGFGAASDFTWSVTGVVGYDFHLGQLPAAVYVGYRAIGQDYSTGSGADEFTWDVVQHGPILGLSLRF